MRTLIIKIKKHIVFRVIPLLLACLMLTTSMPLSVFSVGEDEGNASAGKSLVYDYDTLKIQLDGNQIEELSIYPYEKIDISGAGVPENADYQWQIKHPERNNLWVDIYDATENTIGVSAALISNMLAEDGTAALRLRAYTEDHAYFSRPVTVTLLDEEQPAPALSVETVTFPSALADETTETPEFVTVTINYKRYDYYKNSDGDYVLDTAGVPAFTSYVATLVYNGSLPTKEITLPTIVGYDAYLCDHSGNDHSIDNNESEVLGKTITLNVPDNITQDYVFQIDYLPAKVNYTVRYFLQNIYDDLYVEDIDEKVVNSGFTGSEPAESDIKKTIEGFTTLYHVPDTIAADGSTVFEVYYERNYYLMEFDCAGGYGTDTLYVRHGTHITVADPVKSGYVFNGWDSNGDGIADTLPSTMPIGNSAYTAIWETATTTFTTVYWVDGKYLGSCEIGSKSAVIANGADDEYRLTSSTIICGIDEHNHTTAGCDIICGIDEHEHHYYHSKDTCYNYVTTWGGDVADNANDWEVIKAANQKHTDVDDTYIYVIWTDSNPTLWPKMLINGEYLTINVNGSQTVDKSTLASITEGDMLAEATYDNYHVQKYKASTDCAIDACSADCDKAHSHGATCSSCGLAEHTHDTATCCVDELRFMEFSSADSKTVEGDGSTIVNIYYSYKEYELRFYYAKSTGSGDNMDYYVVGGSTYYFGGQHGIVSYDNYNNSSTIDMLDRMFSQNDQIGKVDKPTLNALGNSRNYKTGTTTSGDATYHYIAFNAKYGDNIYNLWPCDVFNSTTYYGEKINGWSGNQAFVSAWNGEHHVWYSKNISNETIKGKYERLDYKLLYDSSFTDSSTVSYLCFWENGAKRDWNIPKLFRYNICIEVEDWQDETTLTIKEFNGKKYYIYDQYETCDDSNLAGQTQPALMGYVADNPDRSEEPIELTEEQKKLYQSGTDVFFYYVTNKNDILFYNYNEYIAEKGKTDIAYATPLSEYEIGRSEMHNTYYPDGIEPGAYEFGGWYTSPGCYDGTEVDWATLTMPNGDLTLYAKWTPIQRNVYFYLTYEDIAINDTWETTNYEGKPVSYPIVVDHGSLLGTTYSYNPTHPNGYTFVGWFYMDENGKKRFAPDSMEVKQDLHLFAEWKSDVTTEYEVHYIYTDDNGTTTEIGTVTTGYATAGQTKTFEAKGGTALKVEYQSNYFPITNSHSLVMDADKSQNVYNFEYLYDDYVLYKVRYVDSATNLEIHPSTENIETRDAIVTEKFLPISGYMPLPQNYYITKTLAYDDDATEAIEENIITFYYKKDTDHGLWLVEHYVENVDSTDPTNSANYHFYQSVVNISDLTNPDGSAVVITGVPFDDSVLPGYTHISSLDTVITYNEDNSIKSSSVGKGLSATLDYTGVTIRIYYKRNSYPYLIRFVDEYGNVLGYGAAGDNTVYSMAQIDEKKPVAKYESTVTYTAPGTIKFGNDTYLLNDTQTKDRKISIVTNSITTYADLKDNILTFVYKKKVVPVYYHAVCTIPDVTDFGKVSVNNEIKADPDGSNALPGNGFKFVGWYEDAACTVPVASSWINGTAINPPSPKSDLNEVHYYALFEPIYTDFTITKSGVSADDGNRSFLFNVKGHGKFEYIDVTVTVQGNSSVVIKDLPVGTYTVTEITSWSWEYSANGVSTTNISDPTIISASQIEVTLEEKDGQQITFTNEDKDPNWLNGENYNENQFTVNQQNN